MLNFIRWRSCKLENVIFEFATASWVPKIWITFFPILLWWWMGMKHLWKTHPFVAPFMIQLMQASVNWVKVVCNYLFKVLLKYQSFLYSSICSICSISSILSSTRIDSRSNFPYNFYFEVPFIGLGKAKAALHYLDSNFYGKIIIHYYSLLSFPLFLVLFPIIPFIYYYSVHNSYEQEYFHKSFSKSYSQLLCKKLFFT